MTSKGRTGVLPGGDVPVKARARRSSRWVDISVPLRDGMVHWPGDPPVRIHRVSDIARGDSHTLSEISIGSHSGTHIDAPLHFIDGGASIAQMPVDATIGSARVLQIRDPALIRPEDLAAHRIRRGERVLFKTRNSAAAWRSGTFAESFVSLSAEAASFLASRGVRAVGVDYLSAGGYKQGGRLVHEILLGAGVWIIEGLNLRGVRPGRYYLVCLPLRIEEGDGAPARAVLRRV